MTTSAQCAPYEEEAEEEEEERVRGEHVRGAAPLTCS